MVADAVFFFDRACPVSGAVMAVWAHEDIPRPRGRQAKTYAFRMRFNTGTPVEAFAEAPASAALAAPILAVLGERLMPTAAPPGSFATVEAELATEEVARGGCVVGVVLADLEEPFKLLMASNSSQKHSGMTFVRSLRCILRNSEAFSLPVAQLWYSRTVTPKPITAAMLACVMTLLATAMCCAHKS